MNTEEARTLMQMEFGYAQLKNYPVKMEAYSIVLEALKLLDLQEQGRLNISAVGIGQKLYEPNEYGEVYEWEVISVSIGGCESESYLCERDEGTDVFTFGFGDIGKSVFLTREAAKSALTDK